LQAWHWIKKYEDEHVPEITNVPEAKNFRDVLIVAE
jgi:hypothetical protein